MKRLVALLALTLAATTPAAYADPQVGELTLHRCQVTPRALCGSIERPWEPGNPDAGTVTVGFDTGPGSAGHDHRHDDPCGLSVPSGAAEGVASGPCSWRAVLRRGNGWKPGPTMGFAD